MFFVSRLLVCYLCKLQYMGLFRVMWNRTRRRFSATSMMNLIVETCLCRALSRFQLFWNKMSYTHSTKYHILSIFLFLCKRKNFLRESSFNIVPFFCCKKFLQLQRKYSNIFFPLKYKLMESNKHDCSRISCHQCIYYHSL